MKTSRSWRGGGRTRRSRRLAALVALAFVTSLAYSRVFDLGFVNIDDDAYVTENSSVRQGLTLGGLRWALTSTEHANWHPATWVSHMIDVSLFGMNPAGHHAMNLAFHVANTMLLFAALLAFTGGFWRSALVAALFALHPLHVESVAWIAERKDVLSTFFWLLTIHAYHCYTRRPGAWRHLLVALSFALGIAAKPMLVTLPFTLLLLDYWPLGRVRRRGAPAAATALITPQARGLWVEKLPLLVISALSGAITLYAQAQAGATRTMEAFPLGARMANALVSYVSYLGKSVFPRDLALYYPYRGAISPPELLAAALLLAALTVVALRMRVLPAAGMGWLWYLGTLFPVIGIVQVGGQAMADRYTYVPLLGIFIAIAWGLAHLVEKSRRLAPWATVAAVAALGVLLLATRHQMQMWRSSADVLRHALRATENNWLVEYNYGVELARAERPAEAIEHLQRAIAANPMLAEAHNVLGVLLDRQGRLPEALAHFRRAVALDPGLAQARMHLGLTLERLGYREEAIRVYEQVVKGQPKR